MKLAIMSAAEQRLTELLSAGTKTQLVGFKISGNAGNVPTKDGTQPIGAIVYQGDNTQIRYSVISQNEITFVVYLDHDLGQFFFGNMMLFLKARSASEPPIPFLWATLDQQTDKNKTDVVQYQVGNRLLIHCTIWFPYIANSIDLTPHREFVAHLVNWRDELAIPSVPTAEYDQLALEKHSLYDATTIANKDTVRDYWWGLAFSQYQFDPKFGGMSGGVIGQKFGSPSDVTYYLGDHFSRDNKSFELIDGGSAWAAATGTPIQGGIF